MMMHGPYPVPDPRCGTMHSPLTKLTQALADLLLQRNEQLAAAESCTGGLVAKSLTDLPGSSLWFERGLITYSNQAKQDLLGVPPSVLEHEGAVSRACAVAMVEGLLARSPCHWGVAITGIAGPGGGTAAKPVGTVWIAWQQRGVAAQPALQQLGGTREQIRESAALIAIQGLIGRLTRASRPPPPPSNNDSELL